MKISIEEYVASNNPAAVMALLKDMGAPKPRNHQDLVEKLKIAVRKYGQRAFDKIAEMDTPYRSLVLSKHETTSGCDGGCKCGGACGGHSNFTGGNTELELENLPQAEPAPTIIQQPAPVTPVVAPLMHSPTMPTFDGYFKLHPVARGVGITLLGLGVVYAMVKIVK